MEDVGDEVVAHLGSLDIEDAAVQDTTRGEGQVNRIIPRDMNKSRWQTAMVKLKSSWRVT
jgi:hypothetical protein